MPLGEDLLLQNTVRYVERGTQLACETDTGHHDLLPDATVWGELTRRKPTLENKPDDQGSLEQSARYDRSNGGLTTLAKLDNATELASGLRVLIAMTTRSTMGERFDFARPLSLSASRQYLSNRREKSNN